MPYLWLALLILSGILEALTTQLLFVWFMPGTLVAMVLAFLKVSVWIQVVVFVALTAVGLVLAKTVFRNMLLPKEKEKFNIDAVIGTKCRVIERIDNIAGNGAVKVNGLEWAARALSDEEEIEAETLVEVVAVEGVKLICKPIR